MPNLTPLPDARENRLLAALPEPVWKRLRPAFERVRLAPRRPLCESGQAMAYAYFPAGALISLMCVTANGASAESALIGNDGIVGISLLLGGGAACGRAIVETPGDAFRVPAGVLRDEFDRAGALMHVLLRYLQALLTQTAQIAICNRHHTVAQQFACSLLQSLDRQWGMELQMTHEVIAERLGVRREGITECANRLRHQGVIRYSRGHISVLDRRGLERQACECYGVVKGEYRRLLPHSLCLAEPGAHLFEPLAA